MIAISGRNTSTCALAVMSIQTLTDEQRLHPRRAERGGSCSTWRSYQSVNASRPQSCRLQSCAPAACSSSRRVTGAGSKNPARGGSRRRASRARTARARRAARPRRESRSRACVRARPRAAASGSAALRSSTFFERPRTLCFVGQREGEVRHDGVEERHARLERVGHRRAVGLHEQVVDEVDAEVDVLQPRELVGACRSRRIARGRRRRGRTRCARPRELGAQRRGRRSPSSRGGARAAAGAPRGRSASPCSRSSPSPSSVGSRSTSGRASRASGATRSASRSAA